MKHCGKLTAALLGVLLAGSCLLASCGGGTGSSESSVPSGAGGPESDSSQTGNLYQKPTGEYTLEYLEKPAFSFSETDFRVCVYDNTVQTTYFSEEIGYDKYATTDTVINEAVKTRNDLIEETFGVEVVPYYVTDVYVTVRDASQSGVDLYDAAMPFLYDCTVLAQNGMLQDLMQFDELTLEAPWWDQAANQSLSIANKLYFTVGDISFMQKICSGAIAFNKDLYRQFCEQEYGDLYQLVRDHKWTVDLMAEMGKQAAADVDGEAGMSHKDRWGLVGSNGVVSSFYCASDEQLIGKDAADRPMLKFGTERTVTIAQKLLGMMQEGEGNWFLNVQRLQGQVPDIWKTSVDVFGENRSLFYYTAFSAIKKLRAYPNMSDFGLVPLPLVDETQEKYHSLSGGYGVCIPMGVRNPNFSAYMLDALSCYAKNTVTPAYYDVTLKVRDAKDEESEEMLDQYIFSNLVYELGSIYDFGGVNSMFSQLMEQKSTNVVSALDARRGAIEAAIETCLTAYELAG